jgi:hypothetical protein
MALTHASPEYATLTWEPVGFDALYVVAALVYALCKSDAICAIGLAAPTYGA